MEDHIPGVEIQNRIAVQRMNRRRDVFDGSLHNGSYRWTSDTTNWWGRGGDRDWRGHCCGAGEKAVHLILDRVIWNLGERHHPCPSNPRHQIWDFYTHWLARAETIPHPSKHMPACYQVLLLLPNSPIPLLPAWCPLFLPMSSMSSSHLYRRRQPVSALTVLLFILFAYLYSVYNA